MANVAAAGLNHLDLLKASGGFYTGPPSCLLRRHRRSARRDGGEDADPRGRAAGCAGLALEWRARLQPGETVLVLGATGAMGNVAVQAARALGAGRVVAAARSGERLQRLLERGADAVVALDAEPDLESALQEASGGADVIVDPLWGAPGIAAMQAAAHGGRHVQVGREGPHTKLVVGPT